jgi:hypothetical protein
MQTISKGNPFMTPVSQRWRSSGGFVFATWLASAVVLSAQTTVTIGTQHFTDGQRIGTGTFLTAVSGQPTPFDTFFGSDATGPNFDAQWTMSFTPPAAITSATLTFGIYDHDSQASGNQVSLFTAAGADLTVSLNAAFEGHGGANTEYDVYSILLPASTFGTLAGGSASFHLTLQGPGLSVLGETLNNGAGLDFASLTVVPEPGSVPLLGIGFALLFVFRNRGRR